MQPRSLAMALTLFSMGCGSEKPAAQTTAPPAGGPPAYAEASYSNIQFKDVANANETVQEGKLPLVFRDRNGKKVDLADFRGRKNLVLVFTRGFDHSHCPYCSTQTSRLIANYPHFADRDAEVLVVFPGDASYVAEFVERSRAPYGANKDVPFPILLDEELKAVDQLGIRGNLAKPATYIVDKKGQVRYAYVGRSTADRPSVKALLDQLDLINGKET